MNYKIIKKIITKIDPSLAERATISAQETVTGHSLSTASLIVFMYLKFLIPKLLDVDFSDCTPFAVSNRSDASHDCIFIQIQIFIYSRNKINYKKKITEMIICLSVYINLYVHRSCCDAHVNRKIHYYLINCLCNITLQVEEVNVHEWTYNHLRLNNDMIMDEWTLTTQSWKRFLIHETAVFPCL